MTRGQCHLKTQYARTTLGRCNSRSNNNVFIIDVDKSKTDVIIVDMPESSNRRSGHSGASTKLNKKCSWSNVISIDDEGNGGDDGASNADQNATTSNAHRPSLKKYFSDESDGDECQVLGGKGEIHSESPKWMSDSLSSESSASVSELSENDMSESGIFETSCSDGDSDCEIMDDSSGNFREEWEKAASRKKVDRGQAPPKEGSGVFGFHNKPGISMCETAQEKNDLASNSGDAYAVPNKGKVHSNVRSSTNREEDLPHVPDVVDGFTEAFSLNFKSKYSVNDLDHTGRTGSQNQNEPCLGSSHRAQHHPEFLFDDKFNSCGQDAPVLGLFSCHMEKWHDVHGQSDGVCSINREGAEFPDKQQDEDMLRHQSSPCYSQHVPEAQSGKVTDVSEDISSFHQQATFASELNTSPSETHTGMATGHCSGGVATVCLGSLGDLKQENWNPEMIEQSNPENINMMPDIEKDIVGEWEKHKESKEYRLAEVKKWAAQRQQLQIKIEEVQKLRKRKKAENLRLLEMEKRQKQRVEELRESQKQDEETISLKDQLRAEVRKELKKLEIKHSDMASLLRGLGILVDGGLHPMPCEVNAAYRQAQRRFHPDRASRTDIRQQVEAEETFKLISRLKEKLLPVSY